MNTSLLFQGEWVKAATPEAEAFISIVCVVEDDGFKSPCQPYGFGFALDMLERK